VDLGGTKVEAVVLDPEGRERVRLRRPTPRGYPATVEAVVALIRAVEEEAGGRGTVGVGIPGTVSPVTGRIKNANSTWLNGMPLDRDLARRLGRPVRLMNDANCFVLSEAVDGAGAGADPVFGVILGTGVGGGLVVGGRILAGSQRIAGEWGHTPLPRPGPEERPGPACWCGRRGCVETFLSGPGLAGDHARVTGREWTPEEIAVRAGAGDPGARAALDRYAERLGRSLAVVVNLVDPEVVVLGGGLSNLPGLAHAAREALAPHVFTDEPTTRVARNRHGDSSGVRGAAWLWSREAPEGSVEARVRGTGETGGGAPEDGTGGG
jgi:fructokinase